MIQSITGSVCAAGGGFLSMPIIPDWMVISLLALVVSAIFLSFIYILAGIFGNQGLNAFAKYELFELGATVIILLLVTSFSSVLCTTKVSDVFSNVAPQFANKNFYDASFYYIEAGDSFLIGWMTATQIFALYMDQLASTTIYAKPLSMGLITSPGAGIGGPIKSMLYQINNALAVAFVVNHAQFSVLEFAMYGFVNFYFPIGIILRSFTPTRRLGGSLIALGLGFLLVYPLLTVASAYIVYSPVDTLNTKIWENFENPVSKMEDMSSGDMQELKKWFKESVSVSDKISNPDGSVKLETNFDPNNPVSSMGSGTSSATDVVWGIFSGTESGIAGFFKSTLYAFLMIPLSAVSMAFVAFFAMPAICILILIQSIKSMGRMLGDEIDVTVLTRLI
jgi:hypothetical protein